MGSSKQPVAPKRKKKGRPSLLDLQKRSLRLQKLQQQHHQQLQSNNPNPNPNPYLRFPPGRRITRRNPNPNPDASSAAGDDDEDDDSGETRRAKKLKLVLRLHGRDGTSPAGSESDADAGPEKAERLSSSKATASLQEAAASDSGPTTPLPDKKLLVFILDRLQKKDTYSVFSEPVDPKDLPDYHEVIKRPMDFGTVRKKLANGAYANLEQFEKDVFLISSNAMRYNAPDTIYYRQARSIHELARKNFENLRQESDDNEPEPKTVVRRGRPPSKNVKRTVGRPTADCAASDFSSDATLANAGDGAQWSNLSGDLSRKGSASDKTGVADVSARSSYGLRSTETSWMGGNKSETIEEYSGSAVKGVSTKSWKKLPIPDENRRSTYNQPQQFTFVHEPSVLTAFDGEKKQLLPIGLHLEHAYAKSLARFAANLGPVAWVIASKKIERVLPSGTRFGRGWVGDSEALQQSHQPILSTSPPRQSSQANTSPSTISRGDKHPERLESHSNDSTIGENHHSTASPPSVSASVTANRSSNCIQGAESTRGMNYEGGSSLLGGGGGGSNIHSRAPIQLHLNPGIQPTANGCTTAFAFNLPSQAGKMVKPTKPPGSFGLEAPMMHARALNMVSRSSSAFIHQAPMTQLDVDRTKPVTSSSTVSSVISGNPLPEPSHNPQGSWRSLQQKPDSVPPDLNVRFQSPSSPASGVMVDSQQPDLALQL